ncbi:hypothetical protein GN244_ATG04835 [Phytophthora infestans]|uniref:Uncharacterized protein n=1 Tax=Phytophthora infestans TaxID=4787 RepID=A0A833SM07_PHYIN|nr:hypothetical protein GN244_ATG04835 [Phytophthora infestans]
MTMRPAADSDETKARTDIQLPYPFRAQRSGKTTNFAAGDGVVTQTSAKRRTKDKRKTKDERRTRNEGSDGRIIV